MNPARDPNSDKYPDRIWYGGRWRTLEQICRHQRTNRETMRERAAKNDLSPRADTSVPTAVVGPVIAQLVDERWPERCRPDGEEWGFTILAEKVGCHPDTIDGIVRQQGKRTEFDLVDRVLCALGRPDLWQGVLNDVYRAVELPAEETLEHAA